MLLVVIVLQHLDQPAAPIDLGTAYYPSQSSSYRTTAHEWRFYRHNQPYGIDYAHGDNAMARLKADHRQLARQHKFKWTGADRFVWIAPNACRGREWDCIYQHIYRRSSIDLDPLLRRLHAHASQQNWSPTRTAQWLLAFVQQIEYRLPKQYAFGVLPPALVASQAWGDCDSKSLLLIYLLQHFNIESTLLVSHSKAHALVGIHVPSSGSGYHHRGRVYAWAETTAHSAPLGWIHPKFKNTPDWQVVDVN